MRDNQKRKKKYCEAPPRSPRAKFVTSFIITLTLLLSFVGFYVVYRNSQNLGWGDAKEIFSIARTDDNVNITVMENEYSLDKNLVSGADSVINKLNSLRTTLMPPGFRLTGNLTGKGLEEANRAAEKLLRDSGVISQ